MAPLERVRPRRPAIAIAIAVAAGALALTAGVAVFSLRGGVVAMHHNHGVALIQVEGNPMGTLPSISSSCITGNTACIVAVPGGSLRLTSIHFPNGPGTPGAADAVGYVNGRFVSGTIQLSSQPVHDIDREGHDPAVVAAGGPPSPTAKQAWPNGPPAVQLNQRIQHNQQKQRQLQAQKAKARKLQAGWERGQRRGRGRGRGLKPAKNVQKLADVDHEKASEEQYKAALAAVEGHMKERMDKVEEEATKIAEAVTRVITSPEVSKKIADLAMDAAAAKAGPASEASATGGVQGGVDGVGQFGYSNEPAGTVGVGCGVGCADAVATTPDLDTVSTRPPPPPASSAFYAAWKASGGQTGTVQVPHTVVIQNPPPAQSMPVWPATGQPLAPYTLSAAMMGASGFVHGEPLPPEAASVEPVVPGGDAAPAAQDSATAPQAMGVPVQLHQMKLVGAQGGAQAQQLSQASAARSGAGSSMMAQMRAILESPGGASAAAQYQQAAQHPTSVQEAPDPAPAPARGASAAGAALLDPWGAFSAFQKHV